MDVYINGNLVGFISLYGYDSILSEIKSLLVNYVKTLKEYDYSFDRLKLNKDTVDSIINYFKKALGDLKTLILYYYSRVEFDESLRVSFITTELEKLNSYFVSGLESLNKLQFIQSFDYTNSTLEFDCSYLYL